VGFNTNVKEGVVYLDNDVIYIFERILRPIIENFGPEFILVSCGFDGLKGDQIGQ
jgi:histone deacetylase 6